MHDLQPMLAFAIEVANTAHAFQVDKQDQPYILHIMRVATSPRMRNIRDQIVAILHDIVEDTPTTLLDLKPHFFPFDIDAVDCLTRRADESYDDYITRLMSNHRAMVVKLADLDDHISRVHQLTHEDRNRLGLRYIRSRDRIEQELQRRNICDPSTMAT